MENSTEFPTFGHAKQTTIVFLLSLLKCKLNKGLRKTVNSTQDYSSKSVNFFQDDTRNERSRKCVNH